MNPFRPKQDAWPLEPHTVRRISRAADVLSIVVCFVFAAYVAVQVITAVLIAAHTF